MAQAVPQSREIAAWLTAFRDSLDAGAADTLTGELVEAVLAEVPDFVRDDELAAMATVGFRTSVRLLRDLLPAGDFDETVMEGTSVLDLGSELARRQVDVTVLLKTFAAARRVFWGYVMRRALTADHAPAFRGNLLNFLWETMSRSLELLSDAVVAAYFEESRLLAQNTLVRRAETIGRILDGHPVDDETATRQLGHNVHAHQTAFVLACTGQRTTGRPRRELDRLARAIATALGAPPPLTTASGTDRLLVWTATADAPTVADLRGVGDIPRPPGTLVAASAAGRGTHGLRTAHREALRAEQLAGGHGTMPYVLYQDVEVASCLGADREAARALVDRTLGDLAHDTPVAARLRETLLTYLRCGSAAKAAQTLMVHRNTVLYRIQQAENILQTPLGDAQFELQAALTLLEAAGDDWYPRGGGA